MQQSYLARAQLYLKQKDYELAKWDYDRFIQFDDQYEKAYTDRAACHYKLGNLVAACEDMKKAALLGNQDANDYVKKFCKD